MNKLVKKTDVAWLAGIIDGEGSIFTTMPNKHGWYLCRLQIVNTDEGILFEIRRILDEWLVFYKFRQIPLSKLGKLPCFRIEVYRQAELAFIFGNTVPYLKSIRKQKAQFILQILEKNKRVDGKRSNKMQKVRQRPLL